MDALSDVICEVLGERSLTPEERARRSKLIGLLFRLARDLDTARAEAYVEATAEIPVDKLIAAVASVLRSREYQSVPTIGQLWAAAREAAGMDREQYQAGHYLPPPRGWPPPGKKHAICAGELEAMPKGALRLPSGSFAQLEAGES